MKKYILISLAALSMGTFATGCSGDNQDTANKDEKEKTVAEPVNKDSIEKAEIAAREAREAALQEAEKMESLRIEEQRALQARLDSIRQDSINTEEKMRLIPYKFLSSDIEKSLSPFGFEEDAEANTENAQVCLSRTLFGRKITVVGNSSPGTKLYSIIFSDGNEKEALVNEIRAMGDIGWENAGNVYFDNTGRSNDYFRIDEDRITYGAPYQAH